MMSWRLDVWTPYTRTSTYVSHEVFTDHDAAVSAYVDQELLPGGWKRLVAVKEVVLKIKTKSTRGSDKGVSE